MYRRLLLAFPACLGCGRFNFDPLLETGDAANDAALVRCTNGAAFASRTDYGTGAMPYSAVIHDLDADGDLDVVTTAWSVGAINVLLGNGDGTLQPFVSYAVPPRPVSIAVARINADGAPDLVVATQFGISVLMNRGNGAFDLGVNYSTSASSDIVAADFDRDGDTDLAATTLGGELIVYTNDGSGIFTWVVVPASGSGHFGLGGGDVDADGDLDLVTAGELSGNVSILTNDGAGNFLATATYGSVQSSEIAVGDFNGDARPDLGIISSTRVGVEVLLNTGPTFAPSMLFATIAVGSDVSTIDIDADGDLDLLVADGPDESASVLAGAGDGTFSAPTTYAVASEPSSVAAGDLDQDGHLDLVVSNVLAGSVSVLLGRCL